MTKTSGTTFPWLRSHNAKPAITNSNWRELSVIAFVLMVNGAVAQAQQPTKVPRMGYLTGTSLSANSSRTSAFRQGLRELRYVEGENIVIDWRSADGKAGRLPALAAELVRLKEDLIITGGPTSNRAAKDATVTIPIVMAYDNDPVGNGFVTSLKAYAAGALIAMAAETMIPEAFHNGPRYSGVIAATGFTAVILLRELAR